MDQTTDKNMSNFEIKLRKYAALLDTNTTKHQHMEIMDHLFDKQLLVVYSKDIRSIWTEQGSSGKEMTYDGLFGFIDEFQFRSRLLKMSKKLTIVEYTPLGASRAVVTLQIDLDGKQTLAKFVITLKGGKIIEAREVDLTDKKAVKKAVRDTKKNAVKRFFENDFFEDKLHLSGFTVAMIII